MYNRRSNHHQAQFHWCWHSRESPNRSAPCWARRPANPTIIPRFNTKYCLLIKCQSYNHTTLQHRILPFDKVPILQLYHTATNPTITPRFDTECCPLIKSILEIKSILQVYHTSANPTIIPYFDIECCLVTKSILVIKPILQIYHASIYRVIFFTGPFLKSLSMENLG